MSESAEWTGPAKHLVIVGQMGVGKTTLARLLAERLGWQMRDSDVDIATLTGRVGAELASEQSVAYLHELERAVLLGAVADPEPRVVAAAASVIDDDLVVDALRSTARVVALNAPAAVILRRQRSGNHRRPMSVDELDELVRRRRPRIHDLADLVVDAQLPPDVLADHIVRWLRAVELSEGDRI